MRSLRGQPERGVEQFNEFFLHYDDVPEELWRWENFTPKEIACSKTGQIYVESVSLDCLQRGRDIAGLPFHCNSAHRSRVHNANVRGAPRSRHLLLAFDISLVNHHPVVLYIQLRQAGFGSFGIYKRFMHCDIRPGRMWWSSHEVKREWARMFSDPEVRLA